MADNTPGVGRSGFAGVSAQQAAMSENNRQYNDAIRHLAINNPQLRKDPLTLSALAKEYGHSVADVSSAIQIAHMHAITQRSLWGNLTHYYNNVNNWVNNATGNILSPTKWGNFANNFTLGVQDAVVGLGKFVGGVGTDLFHTLTHPNELAYQVQQSTGGPNASVGRVMASPFINAGHLVGSAWENVGNTFGYYGSLIKQKGYGYAFGEAMPSTLLAALTGGAAGRLIGTEIGDAAALDNAAWAARIHRQIDADTKLINDVKDWNEVSAADMVDYARANQRLNSLEPGQYVSEEAILTLERSPIAADRELGANLRERYGVLQMTEDDIKAYEKAFPGAEWAADNMRAINQQFEYDAINKVLGRRKVTLLGEKWADKSRFLGDAARTAIKAVSTMNKGLSSVPAQMFYLSTAAMASEANPELWERTRFGQIVLPNGKTSTIGAELARALGFEDGFFHTVLAGFFNIDLNFVVDDPLTKALRVWGIRNSRYGYTGQLGQMFGGLGIRNPGDVTRAYNQYRKVRYTFDWIAKQDSPSEILKVFRGTFSAGLAKDLAAAKYPSQVINILESVNQGIEMVFSSVPVLSWYSFFKLNLTGALGERFGYMGKILERYDEVNPDLVNSVKESTGVDLTPPNELFQQLNAAGKSKVLWRQRLRRQFIERPRWMNYSIGKETTRIVEVGDINVIPALMSALEVNGVSRLESRAFGDQLVEAAASHDYVAYRNAWKNVWKTVILRPIEALVPHAEYERLLKRFEEVLDFEIEKMLGVDGGGGIGRYVADHDPDWSLLVNEFGEMGHFGVGSMHQGKLILPEPARIKRMQKQLPIMLAGMTSSESEKALRFTENIREHLLQRAEFIEADLNDLVNNWRRTWTIHFEGEAGRIASEDPLIWAARRNVYRYYIKKYGELLTEKSKLGDTRVERVTNMIKELSAAKRGATQQLQEVQAGLERVTGLRHSLERGEALDPAILTAAEIESQIADMYRSVLSAQGELDAVKQLLAETQAMVQKSCFNMQDIEQMVAVNALLSVKELQQRKAWLDAFRKEYTKRSEGAVRPFNIFTLASRRGLRSNHEMVHDFIQSYVNNRWFKPLALTSPAWAMRVSLSEVLVNSLRIGGFNYFESWAAAGIAKQRFRLGKEFDLPAEEQHRIKQVVAGILLGIDEGLIGSIDTVKKARLVQDAVDLMVLHDGHLPMGVHAHRDSVHDDVNEEAVVEALSGTEWNPQNWSKVKDYQLVAADSPYAGKAMHEYMTGIINDTIMGPVMHHMAEIVRQRGTEIFDANADVLYPRIQSAVFDYLQSNAAFLKRQNTLDKLRDDLMEMEDFRRANALERQRMLRELDDEFGNLDNIISASIPKAMEARLNRLYETYETLQVAQAKVSTELDEATAELDRLTSIVEGPGAEVQANATRDRIKAEIDAASEQIRIKKAEYEARKQELEDHPYAPVSQKINSPAYLKYYRDLRSSLIEDLTKNIEEYQTSVTNRLNELFGEHKLVLPRGHYVEMAGNRFMTFVDEEGNVAPAVDLWQSIFEKYPQLWTNNTLRGYFPLGMSGVEGRDALAHIFGMEPAMFGRYPRTDIGKAEFIADYTAHAKVLRSRRASGLERQRSESWMRRYVSATNADWRLKPDAVWKRKEKAFAEGKELAHGLTPDQWFEEAIPLILHNDALTDALRSISWGHYGAAHSALRRVSEHDFNALTDSPRLFTDSEDFISQFSVRGIPASKILGTPRADGLWKNENEVLAELALHMRQRIETEGTNLFNHNIHNSYTLNDYKKFANDFEIAKYVLAEQSAHEVRAQKWLDSIPIAREREFDKATYEIANSLDQMYRAAIGGERELRLIAGQWREMSQEMGLLLKRLNGKYGDLRRLKFGSHFLGDVAGVEGVEATTVDDLLRSILGPEYVSRFVQEDGKIAAAPTLRPALNYADAHELYTAISKYFEKSVAFRNAIEATKALKKVSINGQSLADMTVEGRIAAIKKLINFVPGTEMHVPDTEKFIRGVVGAESPFPAGLIELLRSEPIALVVLDDAFNRFQPGRYSELFSGYGNRQWYVADYEAMDPILRDFIGTINFSDYDGSLFTAKNRVNENVVTYLRDIIEDITGALKTPSAGEKVSAAATGEVGVKAALEKVLGKRGAMGRWAVQRDFEDARKIYGKVIGNPKISDEDFYNAMVKDNFLGQAIDAETKFIDHFWLKLDGLVDSDLIPELAQLILYPEKYGMKNGRDFTAIFAHHFDHKTLMRRHGEHEFDLDISARAITEDSAAPIVTDTLETFMEQLANVKGPNSKVAKAALAELQRAAVAMHLNKNFSNLGANALKDFEKANAARKKLADVVKPVYNPETRTKRQIGKFPSELNGAIGEANVDQLLAALGKHFTAKELDNMFGLGVARDSMDPTIKAANLQQALDNDARFVRAKVSAVDGKLNIDSLMVDLASKKSRNAINETVREIVRYGDMYNMPVQIELMFNPLNYSREGSMPYNSEQYRSLRNWLESFGFITKSDQPSKKDLPGTLIFEKKPTLARFTDRVEPAKFEFPGVSYSESEFKDREKLAKAQLTPRERADAAAEEVRERIAEDAPDPEQVANAKRFWDLFIAPSGVEDPSAHKVWRRAIDMERSRLSVLNDREGYLKLQDQVFAARRELRAAEGNKRRAERSLGRAPTAEDIASGQERARERAEKKVTSLSDREAALEDRIQRNGESIDTVRRTVVTQHSRAVEREAARTRRFYEQRDKAGTIGRRPLIRRIVSRTNTMNDRIEELVGNYVNQQIIRLADDYYSSPEKLAELRSAVEDYAYAHLMTLPKETIDHYPGSRLPLANKELSTGDPMMDWARRIAVSMMGVTSAKTDSKFFAELLHRMDTNNMMGPRQSAAWLRNRIDKKESLPGPFPGKTPAGPLENGASIGLANKISEAAHSKVLGPIVNELVREPVFIWEYHSQMEMLRPLIERGFMTEDQAMVKAQIAASINMMKFVHNPQDKMVWEHNWRLFAPFYFAKNQALRRAFRMGGDNMAAFSKYMKINLAVTEFIAANVEQAAAAFQIPGSQVVASTTASMVGAYLAIFGYKPLSATQNNFGFDASPSSATSIIVTGVHPGAISLLEELIHIPMGPVFSVPAKFVYQHTALNRVWVHDFLTSLIGDVGMRSEIWEDLMPNSFARNAIKGGVGAKSQDGTGSYQSAETWVMSDIMDQMAYSYYEKALKKFPTLSSEQLDKYGSREALAQFYANQQMQDWLSNPSNAQHLLDEANTRTAAMWAFKTIGSVSTPFAVSIGDTFYDNKEFYKMANRRDANGELVYPTIQLASDAYLREHPDQLFAMLPHTKSPYNPYPQIVATSKFIRENEDMVRQYPQMASFFIPQGKRRGGKFDPEAQRMAMSIGLRERISPKEFVQMAQVYSGDKWFAAKELQYRMNPRNIDATNDAGRNYLNVFPENGTYEEKLKVATSSLGIGAQLTWNAYKDLDTEAKLYGRTHNAIWSEHHFGGARASLANDTYKELKQMLKNKDQFVRFAGQEAYDTYKMFSDSIESYHKAFLERKQYNYPTNDLKEAWYAWCTEKALDPANENYAGFIYSVLRKVPDPTPDDF